MSLIELHRQAQEQSALIAALRAQLPRWIACSERMPEPKTPVLIFDLLDRDVSLGRWIAPGRQTWTQGRWETDDHSYPPTRFSHWMPLPAPPHTTATGDGGVS